MTSDPTGALDPEVRAWKPRVPGIREVLRARYAEHAYPPHTHDAWTIFIVDDGAVLYDLERRPRAALPSMVSVLPPWLPHDGRPATSDGYRMRVLYVEPAVLGEARIGAAVDASAHRDPAMWRDLDELHRSLDCPDDALDAEARFALLIDRIVGALPADAAPSTHDVPSHLAEALRAWLDERMTESFTLRDATSDLGASVSVLARSFSRDIGITPHAYVVGRRLDQARDLILDGVPLATVAVDLGFSDQAHLTRAFRRFLGTTPGRYRGSGSAASGGGRTTRAERPSSPRTIDPHRDRRGRPSRELRPAGARRR